MTNEVENKKTSIVPLSVREKVSFGLGSANEVWGNWLLNSMFWPVFNMYLLVSPQLLGTALFLNRFIDLFSDPLFGWLSDNTRSKYGRRRPFILLGSILSGVGLPLFFFLLQPGWSEQTYFWYMVIGSGVFITMVSCFNMPYQSLGAEMSPDYEERTSVFAFKSAIQKIPEIGTFAAAAFITMSIFNKPGTDDPDVLAGARVYTIILGTIMILVGVILVTNVRERYYEKLVERGQERVGILEALIGALNCKPFLAQLAMAVSFGLGTSMVGALGYYLTVYYVCAGDIALGSKWNFAMGASGTVIGILGVSLFFKVSQRFGKRSAMFLVQYITIAVFLLSWFLYNPDYRWLQLIASGLIALSTAGFWMLYGAIGADVIDCDELENGTRREGIFVACGSYLMKVGLALGSLATGFIVAATGFKAELGALQSEQALYMMRILFIVIPVAGALCAIFFLSRFELTRERSEEIRRELEERRGQV